MSDNDIVPTNGTSETSSPYYDAPFEEFVKSIGDVKVGEWQIYAKVLGVSRTTIWRWKQHPMAKAAISQAIGKSMAAMESTGASDWKMHREKLKMLGIEDESKIKLETSVGEVISEIDKQNQNDDVARKAKLKVVEAKQPVQNTG